MDLFVFIIVILGALIAIGSGIWVAFSLGRAISTHRKKQDAIKPSGQSKEKSLYS